MRCKAVCPPEEGFAPLCLSVHLACEIQTEAQGDEIVFRSSPPFGHTYLHPSFFFRTHGDVAA